MEADDDFRSIQGVILKQPVPSTTKSRVMLWWVHVESQQLWRVIKDGQRR